MAGPVAFLDDDGNQVVFDADEARTFVALTGGLDAASGIATGQRSHTVVILDKGDLNTIKGGSGKIWQDDWLAPV